MTKIEQVAAAIQGPIGVSTADAMLAAKRAIEAMREPTEAMLTAVYDPGDGRSDSGMSKTAARHIFMEMIDAALVEPE